MKELDTRGMHKSFKIITLGCKVNQYESAHLEERFGSMGWNRAARKGRADVTVVNPCIVTQRAAYQSRQAIRKAIRENPEGFTAAVGCYGQVFPGELEMIEGLDLVCGNAGKECLPENVMKRGLPGDHQALFRNRTLPTPSH